MLRCHLLLPSRSNMGCVETEQLCSKNEEGRKKKSSYFYRAELKLLEMALGHSGSVRNGHSSSSSFQVERGVCLDLERKGYQCHQWGCSFFNTTGIKKLCRSGWIKRRRKHHIILNCMFDNSPTYPQRLKFSHLSFNVLVSQRWREEKNKVEFLEVLFFTNPM